VTGVVVFVVALAGWQRWRSGGLSLLRYLPLQLPRRRSAQGGLDVERHGCMSMIASTSRLAGLLRGRTCPQIVMLLVQPQAMDDLSRNAACGPAAT
jgi:hypothetical protein